MKKVFIFFLLAVSVFADFRTGVFGPSQGGGGGGGNPGGSVGDWQYKSGASTFGGITPAANWNTVFQTPTSANLRAWITDETGTGLAYFQGGDIGTPSAGVGTNLTGTGASFTAGNATKWTTGRTISITGDLTYTSASLDGSGNVTAAGTLATVNSNVGSFGSSTSIPSLTVNAKGLVTAASGNAVVAPAGTLSGATLASNVLASSLTSVGTLTGGATGAGFTVALATSTLTGNVPISNLAGGTGASSSTFLRGDNTWATPAGSGNVTAAGTLTSNAIVIGQGTTAVATTTTGTGILTALGINTGSAGAPVLFNGAGGTPSSLTGTNITGTAAGLTAGAATNGVTAPSAAAGAGLFALSTGANKEVSFSDTVSTANFTTANVTNLTFADDVRQTFNPGTTNAGLNVGAISGVPSSLNNGDLFYDSSANALKARINGSTVSLGAGGGSPAGSTGDIQINSSGSFGALTPGTGVSTWIATPSSSNLAAAVTGETGSGALMFGTSPSITTDITIPNTGLHLLDTDASHDLVIVPGSNLTADRNLTLTTGDAARTVTISGNSTISQDYSTAGTPQFTRLGLGAATSANVGVTIQGAITGTSGAYAVAEQSTLTPGANSEGAYSFYSTPTVAKGAFTGQTATSFYANLNSSTGAGTITNAYAVHVQNVTIGTNNWAFLSESTGGKVSLGDATDASSTTTGSVQIAGGVGIVKKLFIGDGVTSTAGTNSIGPLVDSVDGTTPLNSITEAIAAGTAYTLTTSYVALDFGTTDPVITIANAGTYTLYFWVQTSLVSATTTNQSVRFKLRRTNNTAADLGSVSRQPLPVATIGSQDGPSCSMFAVKYTTTNTDDSITIQGQISGALGAGTVTVTDARVAAIRAY